MLIFMFLGALPLTARATALGDLQRRVAVAYSHGQLEAHEMDGSDLRGAAEKRVGALSKEEGWLDFYYGIVRDGGAPLTVVLVEFQYDADGSGVVEAYRTNGNLVVRAKFDEFQNLTWEIQD